MLGSLADFVGFAKKKADQDYLGSQAFECLFDLVGTVVPEEHAGRHAFCFVNAHET